MAGEGPGCGPSERRTPRDRRLEAIRWIAVLVADDLNHLLGPLIGYPELIKARLPPGHPASRYCDTMLEAAMRMVDLSTDLMALASTGHFDRSPVDLNELVRRAVDHQMEDGSSTLKIELDLAGDLGPIRGAADRLLLALCHLISTAREAMQDVGLLTLMTESLRIEGPLGRPGRIAPGEYVRLQVGYAGRGLSPEFVDRLFDLEFASIPGVGRRGLGLGLAVARAVVEDHGGCVELKNRTARRSVFSVYLPVWRDV